MSVKVININFVAIRIKLIKAIIRLLVYLHQINHQLNFNLGCFIIFED